MADGGAPGPEPRAVLTSFVGSDDVRPGSWIRPWRVIGSLFVAFPVVRIATVPTEPIVAAAALLATALFGLLAFQLGRRAPDDPRRAAPWLAAGDVAIIGLAAFAVVRSPDQGWIALFYFASTAASLLLPERRALGFIVLSGVVTTLSLLAVADVVDPAGALVQGLAVSIIGVTVFALSALRRTNLRLHAARQELAAMAVAAERDRIARDLHDTLGHSLTLIAIKSELAGRLLPGDPERARMEIADVERVARGSLASVRATVQGDLRPTLDAALADARATLETAGIETTVEDRAGPLPTHIDASAAWLVREATTNVVRHSGAHHVAIRVDRRDGRVEIEVVDDGAGELSASAGGTGLRGLRERFAAIGGTIAAGPTPGGGYRVVGAIPLGDPVDGAVEPASTAPTAATAALRVPRP